MKLISSIPFLVALLYILFFVKNQNIDFYNQKLSILPNDLKLVLFLQFINIRRRFLLYFLTFQVLMGEIERISRKAIHYISHLKVQSQIYQSAPSGSTQKFLSHLYIYSLNFVKVKMLI